VNGGDRDRGQVLILALVITTALAMVVTSLTGYVETSLRAERVAASRIERTATVDGALRIAVELLRQSSANCTDSMVVPVLNGEQVSVSCTGNGLPGATWTRHDLTARVQSPGGGVSVGRATVQLSSPTVPCTTSCTVTINSWLVD
jgi:hypothetical protein